MELGFTKTVLATELGQALGIEGLVLKKGSPLYDFVIKTASDFTRISKDNAALRARLAQVEAKLGRWQGDMRAVLDQRDDYHANVVALRDALDIIQSGFEIRNGDPKMDGTFERFPHALNRSRMMEIAREALAKLENPTRPGDNGYGVVTEHDLD